MGLGSILWMGLKLLGKGIGKGGLGLFSILRSSWIWIPIVFIFNLLPGILGSYAMLKNQGLHWILALISAPGMEIGGFILGMRANALQILNGASGFSKLALWYGFISLALNLIWYYNVWFSVNKFMEGDNVSPFWVVLIGSAIFGLMLSNAVIIDTHVIQDEETRVTGMTYFMDNPGESLKPFGGLIMEAGNRSGTNITLDDFNRSKNESLSDENLSVNKSELEQDALNQTENNSWIEDLLVSIA